MHSLVVMVSDSRQAHVPAHVHLHVRALTSNTRARSIQDTWTKDGFLVDSYMSATTRSFRCRGVIIAVSGPASTPLSAITDSEGRYEVAARPGIYGITANLPRGMKLGYEPMITLEDVRGCVESELWAEYTGELAGRIVDDSGGPIRNLTVEIVRVDGFDSAFSRLRAMTDATGRFLVTNLPIGTYRTGLVIGSHNDTEPRFLFIGGTPDAAGTPRFEIEGGETRTLGTLKIPTYVRIANVRGTVMRLDGQPASGVKVRVKVDSDGRGFPWTTISTDNRGRFSFALPIGTRYRLVAEPWDEALRKDRQAVIKFDPSKDLAPLRLTLP